LNKFKKRIRRRGERVSQSSRVEKDGTRRENDGRVYLRVQKSSKGKWIRGAAIDGRV